MKRPTLNTLAVGIALGMLFSVPAGWTLAQTKLVGGSKFACVDVVKVFNEYERQRDLQNEMDQLKANLQSENDKKRGQIDTMQATLERIDPKDPTYNGKVKELLQLQIEYKNWFDLKQAEMARQAAIWTARMYQEITESIGEIATKEGFDAVFYVDEFIDDARNPDMQAVRDQIRLRKVFWWSKPSDVTASVIEKLNAAYKVAPKQPMLPTP